MRFLLLNGHGIHFSVDKARLYVKEGRYSTEEPKLHVFRPKRIPYDNVVIYGRSGDISLEAIRWLIKHNVAVTILNWDGKLLTTMLPPESVQVKTKFAQYSSYKDSSLRLEIAKKFVEAKVTRSKILLDWLKSRYPEINYNFLTEEDRLEDASNIPEVIRAEARTAILYWKEIRKTIPESYEFDRREYAKKPYGASDKINCMLNYGYAILEAECLRAINMVGLDAHVGFLHEMKMGSNSLAYDLQEPFRFLIDLAVISAIEKKKMQDKDFIRTENYNLRLRPSGAKKLMEEIQIWFSKKVNFKGKEYGWGNVLVEQTRELAHFILGKVSSCKLHEPLFDLNRDDTHEVREIIKGVSYKKWKDLGYSKATLHDLKHKVKEDKAFSLNKSVEEKLLKVK
ncbi:MAG: CRISPR-associated endonuclease Cas1 [Nanoarchaeota archaeon]